MDDELALELVGGAEELSGGGDEDAVSVGDGEDVGEDVCEVTNAANINKHSTLSSGPSVVAVFMLGKTITPQGYSNEWYLD